MLKAHGVTARIMIVVLGLVACSTRSDPDLTDPDDPARVSTDPSALPQNSGFTDEQTAFLEALVEDLPTHDDLERNLERAADATARQIAEHEASMLRWLVGVGLSLAAIGIAGIGVGISMYQKMHRPLDAARFATILAALDVDRGMGTGSERPRWRRRRRDDAA